MKIGFIGLGRMGVGMAANLVRAGHAVSVYNRTAQKAQPLAALGAEAAASIAGVCSGEAVITMLADDNALSQTVFGDGGLLDSMRPGAIHISMSTISVALSQKLTDAHGSAQQLFVAAPVFGRPDAAAAAKLFIVASGAQEAIESTRSLFDAMGQRLFVLGEEPRLANLVKLSGNFLILSVIEALGEAMALIGKAGIDRQQYLDLLTSTLFAAPVYKTYGALIVEGKFDPPGFAAALGLKDIRLALAAGEVLNVPLPLASLLRDRFLTLIAQGGERLDWSAIASLAAKDSGQAG
jgi:3-hydroxyisobutyrate dehydrogenase-like beta-hydroxyacid dehydrogenase